MSSGFVDKWNTQLRKGLLELAILNALAGQQLYGYDIVRRLREVDGLVITEGTVYPILSRLKREGLVLTRLEESTEGPARKYYELSDHGRTLLNGMNGIWKSVCSGIESLQSPQINREYDHD